MKKKIGSLLIAFMMVMTMVPSLAFAGEETNTTDVPITEEYFPDEAFREYLLSEHDWDGDRTLSATDIEELDGIDVEGSQITSLEGIQYLTHLQRLDCSNNKLTSLPPLPSTIWQLNCYDNMLTSLPELPEALEELDCSKNKLTGLPELPSSLVSLNCSMNLLEFLPTLPSNLKDLTCYMNKLTGLPILPAKLETLTASSNKIKGIIDLSQYNRLDVVILDDNCITGVKLHPTLKYDLLDFSMNHMTSKADITGRTDIVWDEGGYFFEYQKDGCEVTGHNYKTTKTIKATTSKNGSIKQKCSKCGDVQTTTIYKVGSVKCNTEKYTYNGKAKKPSVTVKDVKGNTISSKYYTVSYAKGRKAVGRYKVTVKFKTRYSGTKSAYFTIVPKAPSSASATLYAYDDVKFSWKKSTGAKGYSVYYKTETGSYKLLTRTTKTSVKKANLSDGIKYTFKVVPYYKSGSTRYDALTSKTASVYTLKKMATPTVEKYNNSQVKVKWTDIDGQSGYQISKSTSKTGTNIVSTYSTTSGQSKLLKATKNKKYYYKVRAYKTVGKTKIYGPWSSVKAYTLSDKVETVSINITNDNVDEYFEVREVFEWEENAFGEAIRLWACYYVCIKDEYADRVLGLGDVGMLDIAIGYEWDDQDYSSIIDYDNRTYSLSIANENYYSYSGTAKVYSFVKRGDYFAAEDMGTQLHVTEKFPRRINYRITRGTGTLILKK